MLSFPIPNGKVHMAPKDKQKASATDRPEAKNKLMKNPFTYILTVIFLVISVAAFVGFPTTRGGRGGGGQIVFGSFAGQDIAYKPGNFFSMLVKNISDQQPWDPQRGESAYDRGYRIWRRAFDEAAVRVSILRDADKAGYVASEKRVNREIMDLNIYKDDEGKFSLEKFRADSTANRAKLKDEIEENIVLGDYLAGLSDIASSPAEQEFLKAMNSRSRSFSYAVFTAKSLPDSEVIAFGKTKPEVFRNTRVSYLKSDVSKPKLEKIRQQLKDGKTSFDVLLAKESSEYAGAADVLREYWDLESYYGDKKPVDAVMALAAGEYSEVMKTPDGGWIFYYCNEAAKDPDFSDLDTVSRVLGYMRTQEKTKVEEYLLKRGGEFAAKAAAGFEKACAEFGVEPRKVASLPINYGSHPLLSRADLSANPELSGAMSNEAFLAEAFSLKEKGISKPLILGEDAIVLRMDGESESDESANFIIDAYYGYYLDDYYNQQIRGAVLKSPLLKDKFAEVFDRDVMPQEER